MNPSVILCPLSLSPNGRSALAQAFEIARKHEAEVYVLHVRGRQRAALAPAATPLAEARVEPRVAEFISSANPRGARVSVVELSGDPVATVGEYAKRTAADVIVVAKQGRPYGKYWKPGDYAIDLARFAACPTLAVPEMQKAGQQATDSFVEIVSPIDFSSASAAAMSNALALAQQSAGRITLLHVVEGPHEGAHSGARSAEDYCIRLENTDRQLRQLVPPDAHNGFEVRTKVASGEKVGSIIASAGEIDADLIVMGLSDRRAFGPVAMDSTTMAVLRRCDCPVLVIPTNRSEQREMVMSLPSSVMKHVPASFMRPDRPVSELARRTPRHLDRVWTRQVQAACIRWCETGT